MFSYEIFLDQTSIESWLNIKMPKSFQFKTFSKTSNHYEGFPLYMTAKENPKKENSKKQIFFCSLIEFSSLSTQESFNRLKAPIAIDLFHWYVELVCEGAKKNCKINFEEKHDWVKFSRGKRKSEEKSRQGQKWIKKSFAQILFLWFSVGLIWVREKVSLTFWRWVNCITNL